MLKQIGVRMTGLALAAILLATGPASADTKVLADEIRTQYEPLRVLRVAEGLEHPWGVALLPEGYLVTERPGRLNLVIDGEIRRISGTPEVHAFRQGGLLDVVLHPEHASNGWVYLTYSSGDEDGTATALGRGRLEGTQLVDFEQIFVQDRRSEPGRHYGSRIAWLSDGTLLMTIGDRGSEPSRAQDLGDHAGKVIRLNDDGTVPEDNPFVGRDGALPEIWSYGHRNIQGIVVAEGDVVWVTEHGPRGGDELNRIEPGQNYGWPVVSKARDYRTEEQYGEARSRPGYVDPVYEFLPTLAPSGLALVTRDQFPRWRGNLLAGGLAAERIRRVVLEDDVVVHEEELLLGRVGRIRDVREGADGSIYVLTDEDDGGLYRVESAR
ncbi:PQQ-dependent sugar dehydrogenase [Wenzhouxiangella sp. XN24]|uniref:PQQ-dependent sugar dehydrogenase n=1 Tax=Wenzhouxiangella sp. XN24 TaxID=2713569 RepID=UPI0013E9F2C7|nr:PQQ-dependent sugar dehydrogenase [Wenzhouxiangella sp. XN24]NGX15687.1 PQQ-dependent sugar dehydrogenase [Wenzhouxiangella sp. XN24]